MRATLTLLPLAALFAWLGAWQWQRMHDKQELIEQFEHAPQSDYENALSSARPYAHVRVTGHYRNDWHILRDNQIEDGRVGVHVLTLFEPGTGPTLLVNRGWLPLAPDRRSLPEVPTPAGGLTLTGVLATPAASGVRLGDPERYDGMRGPTLVTYLDLPRLAEALETDLSPRLLLLDAGDASGFGKRAWQPAVMLPAQHRAYAVQWFALCAATLILWIALARRHSRRPGVPPSPREDQGT